MGTLGFNIQSIRKHRKLTQTKLAELSGLSKGFMSEVEHDKTDIGLSKLVRVAQALGMSIDALINMDVCPTCGQQIN